MYKHGGDVYQNNVKYDFSANLNPLGIPERVIRAACDGVVESRCYPDPDCAKLRKAISDSIGMMYDYIICGNGAADLIYSLALAIKPKKALIPIPSFYEYEQALKAVDCEIIYVDMKEEEKFCLNKDILSKITKEIDILFLCNPNNPTGYLLQKSLLKKVLDRCKQCEVMLVVDECFMDFVSNSLDYSLMEEINQSKYLFLLKAFTKLYSMAGLRLGYGVSSDTKLLQRMKQVMQPWSVSIPAQLAGIAALSEREYVKKSLEIIREEKEYLMKELQMIKCRVYHSEANYIFFRAMKGLYERCLSKGVLIRDCSNYPGLREGFYRIAVRTHKENEYLIQVMKEEIGCQNQS